MPRRFWSFSLLACTSLIVLPFFAKANEIWQTACDGIFETQEKRSQIKFDLAINFSSSFQTAKVSNVAANKETARLLKFMFLPSPDPVQIQNPTIAGVGFWFNVENESQVLLLPYRLFSWQTDLMTSSDDILVKTRWRPALKPFVSYFGAERDLRINRKQGTVNAKTVVNDYFDRDANAAGIQKFTEVVPATSDTDRYQAEWICKKKPKE